MTRIFLKPANYTSYYSNSAVRTLRDFFFPLQDLKKESKAEKEQDGEKFGEKEYFFFFFFSDQSEGYRNSVPMVKVRPAYFQDKALLQALGCQTDNGLFFFSKIHVCGGNRSARLSADFSCMVQDNLFLRTYIS